MCGTSQSRASSPAGIVPRMRGQQPAKHREPRGLGERAQPVDGKGFVHGSRNAVPVARHSRKNSAAPCCLSSSCHKHMTYVDMSRHIENHIFGGLEMAQRVRWTAAAALALVLAGPVNAAEITGAGSTFVFPILSKWSAEYGARQGVRVNYQSIGSAAGITQIKNATVDFGASDAPLKPAELRQARPGAVSAGDRRHRTGGEYRRDQAGPDPVHRFAARRHLSRQDQELERPRHRQDQSGAQAAQRGDHGRAPFGWLGHDIQLRQLSLQNRAPNGATGSARAPRSNGRSVPAARATRAWPPSCTRRKIRSATSNTPMCCKTG